MVTDWQVDEILAVRDPNNGRRAFSDWFATDDAM
jgi:hypothetical protein